MDPSSPSRSMRKQPPSHTMAAASPRSFSSGRVERMSPQRRDIGHEGGDLIEEASPAPQRSRGMYSSEASAWAADSIGKSRQKRLPRQLRQPASRRADVG